MQLTKEYMEGYRVYVDKTDYGWCVTRRGADDTPDMADMLVDVYEKGGSWWVHQSTCGNLQMPSEFLALHVAKYICFTEDTLKTSSCDIGDYNHML